MWFLKSITCVAPTTSAGAATKSVKVEPSYIAGEFTPSTMDTFLVPVKLYSLKRVLRAPSRLKLIKVIAALSAGLEARLGLIAKNLQLNDAQLSVVDQVQPFYEDLYKKRIGAV